MNLSKKIATQISRYYEDLEKNGKELGPEMSDSLQEGRLYANILQGIEEREKSKLSFRKILAVACITLATLGLSIIGYHQWTISKSIGQQVAMHTATATKGHIIQLSLADGTKIWLNSGSKLSYPQTFDKNTRQVTLEGEAYFQVAHDASKPFLVHSAQLITKVLGTSFNIKAYHEDKNIQVTVLTGKVSVSHPATGSKMDSLLLTPSQQMTFNKEKQHMSLEMLGNTANLISWREGNLYYDGTPLSTVIADLQRKYTVVIRISPALEKRRVTVDFHNESIKKVMIILSEMTGSTVVETNDGYYLH